ncbi:Holliday junction branch migration protein RuvA [Oceanispirochaeta sp.]|uniref:Holliday junction branch migration protein RuvA n=1 Tax=Oceanispirochaeta sp. TaxID=2035350 RepID=UPI0026346FDF|nr:Holliday junction branch migration protein RuvA [Oceanispirochaeta sp.]MDA3957734.1 Holliday junction branch migration protein RuvA [Oceanispirochaeta sp.]
MINSIKGVITEKGDSWICLENQGMEWNLIASGTTISSLPAIGNQARVFTWLYHKEDQMALYGFFSPKERFLFLDLISVSGVGPKGAIKILSAVRPDQLILYLEEENLDGLSSLPGLGKKTAQKILLQLRGKLSWDDSYGSGSGNSGPESEWVESLTAMGFDKRKVLSLVKTLMKDEDISVLSPDKKEQEILRRAIVELSS